MGHRNWIDSDDVAANRVKRDLVVSHHDHIERKRYWRQHSPLTRDDCIDADELWLDDVLEVGDFLIESMIVIDQSMAIILNSDVSLERKRHRGPWVSLELWAVYKEVRLGDRFWREDVVAQTPFVSKRNLDLGFFLKTITLRSSALEHRVVARLGVCSSRGNGDATTLADRELGHLPIVSIGERTKNALDKFRAGVGVFEHFP